MTLTESYKRERSLWGEPEGKKQRGQALQLEEQRPQNPEGWMECEMERPQLCNDPDHLEGVITHTHLQPDILECEIK